MIDHLQAELESYGSWAHDVVFAQGDRDLHIYFKDKAAAMRFKLAW